VARSRSGFHRGQSSRRLTAWSEGVGGTAETAVTSVTPQFLGDSLEPGIPGLTLIRLRGELLISLTQASAAKDGMIGAVAIGIATKAAILAGVVSVPTPITEQDSENWLWYQAFAVVCPTIGTGVSDGVSSASTSASFRVTIDSKAMRKLPEEMALYAMIEVGSELGAAAVSVFLDTRALFKLP